MARPTHRLRGQRQGLGLCLGDLSRKPPGAKRLPEPAREVAVNLTPRFHRVQELSGRGHGPLPVDQKRVSYASEAARFPRDRNSRAVPEARRRERTGKLMKRTSSVVLWGTKQKSRPRTNLVIDTPFPRG
jgi:hypothetical protein